MNQPLLNTSLNSDTDDAKRQPETSPRFSPSRKSHKTRLIHVNPSKDPSSVFRSQVPQKKYKRNRVHTTKYSWISFLPKSLLFQFKRIANIYFLLIVILQVATPFSPTGKVTTLIPLSIVLVFSMMKDGFEDLKRRRGDWEVNHRTVHVFEDGQWKKKQWQRVRVGQVVRVDDKEKFPCDLLLLATSDAYNGLCYVETSQLDGETNFKIRRSPEYTTKALVQNGLADEEGIVDPNHPELLERLNQLDAKISCDLPNKDLYKFNGSLEFEDETKVSLGPNQVLLRGSSLRNTKWVLAVSLYTGHQTKLLKNNLASAPHKTSHLERRTNWFLSFIFFILGILVLISTIGRLIVLTKEKREANNWYLQEFERSGKAMTFKEGIVSFFESIITFLILYNNLVPISLYVSMEIAKFIQGHFMSNDIKMYYEKGDIPAAVRNSALNEELGQVEYIFSDKTGTLTQNRMMFLKFAVNGQAYGTGHTEIERSNARRRGVTLDEDMTTAFPNDQLHQTQYNPDEFKFFDPRVSNNEWTSQTNADKLREFFVLLALCHTVIPEVDPRTKEITYQASSPDEAALVKAAAKLGVKFVHRTPSEVSISILGKRRDYKLLNTLEFTSKRKRSSVIVKDSDGKIILYTKGADSVILPMLNAASIQEAEKTEELLNEFADSGLRTLVCGKCELNQSEYEEWQEKYEHASNLIVGREEELENLSDEIEKNLDLVGATAIEDELQAGVPDTISELAKAGIKLWVLTGDKKNTAINIGFACDLLNNDMGIIDLKGHSVKEITENMDKNFQVALYAEESSECLSLVVEGSTLSIILDDSVLKRRFLKLACQCRSVICCRASPSQKSEVVKLVRRRKKKVTLAIGDGANDVPMINEAHIGIGIAGEEGLQAANASDVSIGRFRFLKRLLLVHGRWSYRRIAKLVLYSFYKNVVLYVTQLWFVFFNWWSGTSIHDKWTVGTYNILFTSLPIMALAIFDRDVPASTAENYPELYRQGHRNSFFSAPIFLGWLFNGLWHSAVCFIIPVYANYYELFTFPGMNGQTMDMLSMGVVIYTSVLLAVTLKCVLETSSFTILHIIGFVLSILVWIAFVFSYGWIWFLFKGHFFPINELYDFAGEYRIMLTLNFWLTVTATALIANLRDIAWKCWKRLVYRKLYYAVQEHGPAKPRADIMKYYPVEDSVPSLQKQITIEMKEMRKLFSEITGMKRYRGFAFSQTPHQEEIKKSNQEQW